MKVLGICGQSGSGKTTALEIFSSFGAVVCDCDEISRKVMKQGTPCVEEIIEEFGIEFVMPDGELDRRALGKYVFANKDKLKKLTQITHFYIKKELYQRLEKARVQNEKLFVIDAPLLFESSLDKDCDITLVITSDKDSRIKRITLRDKIDYETAQNRLSSQLDQTRLIELADESIENSGTKTELYDKIKAFIERRGLLQ